MYSMPPVLPMDNGGYLYNKFMENQKFVKCDDCETSHALQTVDLLGSCTGLLTALSDDT